MTGLDDLFAAQAVAFCDMDGAGRARALHRLADTELYVALTGEPAHDRIELRMFDLEDGRYALACDDEARLAAFLGAAVSYAAMPGRVLAHMLAAESSGLLVNPETPSEMLVGPEMLDWLLQSLDGAKIADEQAVTGRFAPPLVEVVAVLAAPLGARLADFAGLARAAGLVLGDRGHILFLAGVAADHQPPLAKAVAELVSFLPPVEGGVAVGFLSQDDLPAAVREVALCFDLPAPDPVEPSAPRPAPGSDPDKPPRLR